ncbi:MAG: hypothetical protein QOF26_1632 [Baekduia sp.]|jgi:hypothetical protein|nr:hypothetical protein [Baekduia sp.]MDX6701406.1 hypothetical protein [Baekduia sp.]
MSVLGDPPPGLAPLPRAFLGALAALLDELAPPLLDGPMTKASVRGDGVEVVLAHATEIAFSVWAQADAEMILVGCAALHEEFTGADGAGAAIGLVRALLCGRQTVPAYDGAALRPDFGTAPA